MTVSMFDAYYERLPAIRSMRMMDMGQSTSYAQSTNEGRRKIWNNWTSTVTRITHMITLKTQPTTGKSVITWNGEAVDFKFLRKRFGMMFGRGAVS